MEWFAGLKHWRLWGALAYQDIRNRYRRSSLGPLWITITMGITILAMGPLYGDLFGGQDKYFIPRMGFGLIIWSLISSSINDYAECFVSASHYIKNVKLPYSVYIYRIACRQIILFAHNAVLFIPIYILYPELFSRYLFVASGSLILAVIWLTQVGTLIAILCTRYRDLAPLVSNITQLLFFVTPIVWPSDQLSGARRLVLDINPVYYLLESIRMPLMGQPFGDGEVLFVVIVVLVLAFLSHFVLKSKVARLAYWL